MRIKNDHDLLCDFIRQQQELVIAILVDALDAIIQEFLAPSHSKKYLTG